MRPVVVQMPEGIPRELGAGRDKSIFRGIVLRSEGRSIGLLIGYVGEPVGCSVAVLEFPPEERREFFPAPSMNSASISAIARIA